MKMTFKWHFAAFVALSLWMAGCQTPEDQQTSADNSQAANTESSQPAEPAQGAMEQAQPPSADEIIAAEAALASENSGATKPLPAEKKPAAGSEKTVAKSEAPKKEETKSEAVTSADETTAESQPTESKKTAATPDEATASTPTENKAEEKVAEAKPETAKPENSGEMAGSPDPKPAEPPPSESKETATVAASEPTESKTEGQPPPASSENKEAATQPEPAKSETASAKPKIEEITPMAQKSVSESPFIGTVVLSPLRKKFVVVDFRNGEVPPIRSELGVYREGIFVGSVRISEPVKPPLASADILSGALRRGDVVQ